MNLLKEETEPCVRAVLGHFIFVYIHPYMDGNGRISRFLMNAMLASGGYAWTIIPIELRNEYLSALEQASVDQDISEFAKFLAKQGISIAPATINGWFQQVADLMRPTYYRLQELILASNYIQSDETTIPIINNEKHQTVKGYIWMVRAVMDQLVFFHYDHGSRAQKVALGLFKDYQGVIQSDGYAVYDMYENKKGVLPIGCWIHARRKFEEALCEDKARASYALEQIGLLYQVERQADGQNLSFDQRAELRSRLSYPIMVAFEKWLLNEYPKVLPKGRIGKAIRYTYNIYHKHPLPSGRATPN